MEDSNYVTDFICEIVPISVVACVVGIITSLLAKWCIATKAIMFKALLGLGVALLSVMSLLLGFLALLAIFEFAKDVLSHKR